jgi:hypothetical protein
MKTQKLSVLAVLSAPFMLIGALFLATSVVKADVPVIKPPVVTAKIVKIVDPRSADYSAAWANVVNARAGFSFPVAPATSTLAPEYVGSIRLESGCLLTSPVGTSSWKGNFPAPAGFENALGTVYLLVVRVVAEDNSLTLSSVAANFSSSDGSLNASSSFANYAGQYGRTSAGVVILSGSSTIPCKEIVFGVFSGSFRVSNQTEANQYKGYIDGQPDYWIRWGVTGSSSSGQWSVVRTLNTKATRNYGQGLGAVRLVSSPTVPDHWVITGPSSDLPVILKTSEDLSTGVWANKGVRYVGDLLSIRDFSDQIGFFQKLEWEREWQTNP